MLISESLARRWHGFCLPRTILVETVAEHRPLAIVYPDGREIVAAPRGGALAFLGHLLTRGREADIGLPAVLLPADYRVEIRNPRALAD